MDDWSTPILGADLCDVALDDDHQVRCELRVGHGGRHQHCTENQGALITTWWSDAANAPRLLDLSRSGVR